MARKTNVDLSIEVEKNGKKIAYPSEKVNFERAKCDKYDYMIAASCGVLAGLVDVFFVGAPGQSVLQGKVDKGADELVKKASQAFYKFDSRKAGRPKHAPQSLEQSISYLEQAFPVPYDARYAKDLVVGEGVLEWMWSGNHHLYSLAHSPDVIGLIFSIIDQFSNMGSFVDKGQIIRVIPRKTSGAIPYLQGTNVVSRLFSGFVNWIGHLMPDLVGSSSTRAVGKTGRGTGIQMPFYELFLLCDFGNIDGQTFSEIAVAAFEEGYDARFAASMAIPVLLNDVFIRVIWAMKSNFYGGKPWKECVPTNKHDDLRVMIIVGTGSLCINATLAALGGGAIAAGGGGIALGTTILGATTLGVGLLVGGIIFNVTGTKLSDKADEAYRQAKKTEEEVDKICKYLSKLSKYARKFKKSLSMVENSYKEHVNKLDDIINTQGKTHWSDFTDDEKQITENAVLLVGLLYKMCQVQLVLKDKDEDGQNEVNVKGVIDIEGNILDNCTIYSVVL